MDYLLITSVIISFLIAIIAAPLWIKKCKSIGMLWEDMNKYKKPKKTAASGGIIVVMASVLGIFFYIALKTFLYKGSTHSLEIFSLITVILILAIIGLVDDLLGWKNHGLQRKVRLILSLLAAIPLVVINAGVHEINLPFLGLVNLGIIYPLILIPLGIAGATTTYNFLAGYNGLEAGQGIIIISFLSFVAYYTGSPWLTIIGLCMVASLLGFYIFNKYPAKIFPGDVMTYAIGATIAGMAILGNFEKIAVIVFIPYIIEVILKLRGGLIKESFGKPDKKGFLKMPYKKIYGLEHLSIWILNKYNGRATEKKVVYLIHIIQIVFILLALLIMLI